MLLFHSPMTLGLNFSQKALGCRAADTAEVFLKWHLVSLRQLSSARHSVPGGGVPLPQCLLLMLLLPWEWPFVQLQSVC